MRILLVHPEFPRTYWGFQYALPLAGKRANLPPLGLITMAAHLPRGWDVRLRDLNVEPLTTADLDWADVVLTGGMLNQVPSAREVLTRARARGKRTVVGGPAVTTTPALFPTADGVFAGEVEGREADLQALIEGRAGAPTLVELGVERPPITSSAVPRYELLRLERYASMSLQYSRGCPYHCEFCDVIEIFGRVPRVKTPVQVLAELSALYRLGWRGSVFFVDDNFIGNLNKVRKLLPQLRLWQEVRQHPFELYTEASVNLAGEEAVTDEMVAAGFTAVFLGIETPSSEALRAAGKTQNLKQDLRGAVHQLTTTGLEVMGGFIVGFDSDGPGAFEAQRQFLADAPIPLAMVGLLTALPGTQMWKRLQREQRLRATDSGETFGRPNFAPRMDEEALLSGYARLLTQLYSPEGYLQRCEAYLEAAPLPRTGLRRRNHWPAIVARTTLQLGLLSQRRRLYWSLLARARAPADLSWIIQHALQGEHLIRYTSEDVLPRLACALAAVSAERELALFGGRAPLPAVCLEAAAGVRTTGESELLHDLT